MAQRATALKEDIDLLHEEDLEHAPAVSVGLFLKQRRETLNLSIQNIASKIRVRAFYLEAIEMGEFEKIPGTLYLSGFIKLYARVLNLDGEELLRRLDLDRVEPTISERPIYLSSNLEPSRMAYYLSGGIACFSLLLMYIVFFTDTQTEPTKEPAPIMEVSAPPVIKSLVPSTEEATSPSPESSLPTPTESSKETLPATTETSPTPVESMTTTIPTSHHQLTLTATRDCWLDVRRNDIVLFSRILKAGESFIIDNPSDCTMSVGNAGGLRMIYENKDLAPLGKLSEVIKNVHIKELLPSAH